MEIDIFETDRGTNDPGRPRNPVSIRIPDLCTESEWRRFKQTSKIPMTNLHNAEDHEFMDSICHARRDYVKSQWSEEERYLRQHGQLPEDDIASTMPHVFSLPDDFETYYE